MNTSQNARRRDRAILYADHKDEQRDNRDDRNMATPIDLRDVKKAGQDPNSTEKLLRTN